MNGISQNSPLSGTASTASGAVAEGGAGAGPGGDVAVTGGYQRGVFVRAARGSSIDVGLFHDDQQRSVATVEVWVHAGDHVRVSFCSPSGVWFGSVGRRFFFF